MNTISTTDGARRRDFLKVMGAGLASAWLLSGASSPLPTGLLSFSLRPQTSLGALMLRGEQGGRILQSADQGKTWQPLVSFGEHCAVQSLVTHNEQVYVKLMVGSNAFWLRSADTLTWHTAS